MRTSDGKNEGFRAAVVSEETGKDRKDTITAGDRNLIRFHSQKIE